MKTLVKLLLMMIAIGLMVSCNKDELAPGNENLLKSAQSKTITTGFNIVFTGNYDYMGPSDVCGDYPPMVRIINTGQGTGTHMGHFTSYFDFCYDATDDSYPAGHIEAYFQDEDGDILNVTVGGFVMDGRLPGMPSFANSYFKDPFVIIGGTGKFEGATGNGYTNDYNSDKDPYSHHHWTGKITLVKGKR